MKKIIFILLLMLSSISTFAQQSLFPLILSGKVLDEKDSPIPGLIVFLKDRPGVGSATDINGNFEIKAKVGEVLIFTFMGYTRVEYPVTKAEKNIKVIMNPTSHQLDEAVVVGMGLQRKISVVGAITSVDVKELQTPATSIPNMLGGRVPGIISLQKSGEPGKNISEFWIRGIGTFGANSSALVLIDGLDGNLSQIDPSDIESFSVLKDASATAIYGVRGANGVVLVTTKRGQKDKLRITARINRTVSVLERLPVFLRAYDYANLANEARVVRGGTPIYSKTDLDLIKYKLDPDLFPDVNWQDEVLNKTSLQDTYYMSARGGGNVARYFLSLGMSDESSAYIQDKSSRYSADVSYKTYNFRTNLDINLTKTTLLSFGTDGYVALKTEPGMANTDYIWSAQAQLTPLTIPTKFSSGQLPAYGPTDQYSPYVMLNYTGLSTNKNYRGKATLGLNQDLSVFIKGLKFRLLGAYDNETSFNERRYILPEMYAATGRMVNGELSLVKKIEKTSATYSMSQNQYYKTHFETALDYETSIAKENHISGLIYYYMSNQQNANDATSSMNAIPLRYQGLSGRITYGYKDTYFVDGNFGYTGSENFENGHQFGFFPSAAIGWVPTSYQFTKEYFPWLNFLKIRASHGSVGNDRISSTRFPYLTLVNENSASGWSGTGGISETIVGANNLQWESAIKTDVGIEAHLFNDKLNFVVDYFNDQRDGIFQQRTQVPDYVGLQNMPYGNVGKMRSYGADGNISYSLNLTKNFSFTLRSNFTLSKNQVQTWEQATPLFEYQRIQGNPSSLYRGYVALGLFRDAQDVANSPKQTFGLYLPGDIKYKDINGDGKINQDDKIPLSLDVYPSLMYGFGGEFHYKNLTLGVLFKGTGKTTFYYTDSDKGQGFVPFIGEQLGNVLSIVKDQANRWTPASYSGTTETENPNAMFPRLSYGKNENNNQYSSFWRGNSQYLRLQELSLNYNFSNQKILKYLCVSSVDFQVVGSNLFVWDKVHLWDPEQAVQTGKAYPIPMRIAFQMYVNF